MHDCYPYMMRDLPPTPYNYSSSVAIPVVVLFTSIFAEEEGDCNEIGNLPSYQLTFLLRKMNEKI